MSYPPLYLSTILGTECIGDSLPKINGNFLALSATGLYAATLADSLSGYIGSTVVPYTTSWNVGYEYYLKLRPYTSWLVGAAALSAGWVTTSTTSGNWNNAYSAVSLTSATWNNTGTYVNANSANWGNTYSTVKAISATWNNTSAAYAASSAFYTSAYNIAIGGSTRWDNSYTWVYNLSASLSAVNNNLVTRVNNYGTYLTGISSTYVAAPTGVVDADNGKLLTYYSPTSSYRLSATSSLFGANSVSTNSPYMTGYTTLPGGVIMQWGRVNGIITTDAVSAVKFPKVFPTAVLNITTSHVATSASSANVGACSIGSNYTLSGFNLIQDTTGTLSAVNEMWTALGY